MSQCWGAAYLVSSHRALRTEATLTEYGRRQFERLASYQSDMTFPMANKRKHYSGFPDDASSYTKRRRPTPPELLEDDTAGSPYSIQSRVDPTYGQRGAFPGLDDTTGEDELFYGPASNGLEYLRMVR